MILAIGDFNEISVIKAYQKNNSHKKFWCIILDTSWWSKGSFYLKPSSSAILQRSPLVLLKSAFLEIKCDSCHILFCNLLPILALSNNILLPFILQYIIISFYTWRIVRFLMIELYITHNVYVASKYLGWTLGKMYMALSNVPIGKTSGALLPTWKFQVFIDQGCMGVSIQGSQKKDKSPMKYWRTNDSFLHGSLYPLLIKEWRLF